MRLLRKNFIEEKTNAVGVTTGSQFWVNAFINRVHIFFANVAFFLHFSNYFKQKNATGVARGMIY